MARVVCFTAHCLRTRLETRLWQEQGGSTSTHVKLRTRSVSCTRLQRAYNVRSPCDCHVIVRRPYLYVLLTYGVRTYSHVVSACKCDECEFFRLMSGGGGIYRTTFGGAPEVPATAASRCRSFHRRAFILQKSVRTTCVVSAEHVLTRYGPRKFCVLIGQLNWGSTE